MLHPALIWLKSLLAANSVISFILVLGPQEILILNLFSNIKFLVKVKKKKQTPYPSFLTQHLTLWYKYRLKNEKKKQSAFVHSRTTDGN